MLPEEKVVGHTRNIIANNAMTRLAFGLNREIFGHLMRVIHVMAEELFKRCEARLAFLHNG